MGGVTLNSLPLKLVVTHCVKKESLYAHGYYTTYNSNPMTIRVSLLCKL